MLKTITSLLNRAVLGSNAHIEALMRICRRNQIEALSMTLDYLYKSFADLKESTSKSEKSDSEN